MREICNFFVDYAASYSSEEEASEFRSPNDYEVADRKSASPDFGKLDADRDVFVSAKKQRIDLEVEEVRPTAANNNNNIHSHEGRE